MTFCWSPVSRLTVLSQYAMTPRRGRGLPTGKNGGRCPPHGTSIRRPASHLWVRGYRTGELKGGGCRNGCRLSDPRWRQRTPPGLTSQRTKGKEKAPLLGLVPVAGAGLVCTLETCWPIRGVRARRRCVRCSGRHSLIRGLGRRRGRPCKTLVGAPATADRVCPPPR